MCAAGGVLPTAVFESEEELRNFSNARNVVSCVLRRQDKQKVSLRWYLEFYAYDIVVSDSKTTINEEINNFEGGMLNPWFDTTVGMRDHLQEFGFWVTHPVAFHTIPLSEFNATNAASMALFTVSSAIQPLLEYHTLLHSQQQPSL